MGDTKNPHSAEFAGHARARRRDVADLEVSFLARNLRPTVRDGHGSKWA